MEARDHGSEMRVPTSPENLWDAITRPDPSNRRLFEVEEGSAADDVHVGSRVLRRDADGEEAVWGEVVDVERPHRLVMELEPWERSEAFRVTLKIEREGQGSRLAMIWEPLPRPNGHHPNGSAAPAKR
jgi:uncharacterized protein YndB with AHSA1/START domain